MAAYMTVGIYISLFYPVIAKFDRYFVVIRYVGNCVIWFSYVFQNTTDIMLDSNVTDVLMPLMCSHMCLIYNYDFQYISCVSW